MVFMLQLVKQLTHLIKTINLKQNLVYIEKHPIEEGAFPNKITFRKF